MIVASPVLTQASTQKLVQEKCFFFNRVDIGRNQKNVILELTYARQNFIMFFFFKSML